MNWQFDAPKHCSTEHLYKADKQRPFPAEQDACSHAAPTHRSKRPRRNRRT